MGRKRDIHLIYFKFIEWCKLNIGNYEGGPRSQNNKIKRNLKTLSSITPTQNPCFMDVTKGLRKAKQIVSKKSRWTNKKIFEECGVNANRETKQNYHL